MIRLHSEYQNNTGLPADRRDGDHDGLVRADRARLPAPEAAHPARTPRWCPPTTSARSPNRIHGPPDFPARLNPDGSCNPPGQTSGQLTVGTPDANGAARPTSWAR